MTYIPANGLIVRDLEFEENVVRLASSGVMDPNRVIAHSRMRSLQLAGEYVSDPNTIRCGMLRPEEALDEVVDGINHLLFHLQEFPEDEREEDYRAAIRFFLLTYDRIEHAGRA